MQIIPLKAKYHLTDDDINNLSAWIVDGHSLVDICAHFQDKLTAEKIFIVADVIAREMFDLSLQELSPELVVERRHMNVLRYQEWQCKKVSQKLMSLVREALEDLRLFEIEIAAMARQTAESRP